MTIQLQAITPEGHPRGEIITTGGGRILVAHAARPTTPEQHEALCMELSTLVGPEDSVVVLPHGYHLEVLQPVEVP